MTAPATSFAYACAVTLLSGVLGAQAEMPLARDAALGALCERLVVCPTTERDAIDAQLRAAGHAGSELALAALERRAARDVGLLRGENALRRLLRWEPRRAQVVALRAELRELVSGVSPDDPVQRASVLERARAIFDELGRLRRSEPETRVRQRVRDPWLDLQWCAERLGVERTRRRALGGLPIWMLHADLSDELVSFGELHATAAERAWARERELYGEEVWDAYEMCCCAFQPEICSRERAALLWIGYLRELAGASPVRFVRTSFEAAPHGSEQLAMRFSRRDDFLASVCQDTDALQCLVLAPHGRIAVRWQEPRLDVLLLPLARETAAPVTR